MADISISISIFSFRFNYKVDKQLIALILIYFKMIFEAFCLKDKLVFSSQIYRCPLCLKALIFFFFFPFQIKSQIGGMESYALDISDIQVKKRIGFGSFAEVLFLFFFLFLSLS